MISDSSGNRRFYGVYRGSVHSNKDPLNQRRIRLIVPQILGNEATEWAWSKDSGAHNYAVPEVGQGVWVMFEGGDPSFPIYVGTFGKNKYRGRQVHTTPIPDGTYPSTMKFRPSPNGGSELDLTATVIAIAKTVEAIRLSLNAHGGGSTEAPPTDVSNY
jgi:hypothetical protein